MFTPFSALPNKRVYLACSCSFIGEKFSFYVHRLNIFLIFDAGPQTVCTCAPRGTQQVQDNGGSSIQGRHRVHTGSGQGVYVLDYTYYDKCCSSSELEYRYQTRVQVPYTPRSPCKYVQCGENKVLSLFLCRYFYFLCPHPCPLCMK